MYSLFNLGAGWRGWLKPRPVRSTSDDVPVPILQEARWAPETVWTGAEDLSPPEVQFPKQVTLRTAQSRPTAK